MYTLHTHTISLKFETLATVHRFGTLGGTMTLRRTRIKDGEKEIDPKMEELKRQLNTEDGGNGLLKSGQTLLLIFPPNFAQCFSKVVII
jgi:hypothetical protein